MKPSVPSAVPPSRHRLPGGMRLGFIALPPGSQAAALVRVHAGAHDAPLDYPGLAHFLEHLLFLGSHGYPQAQSLMPFVQGCGGQLNASTRERHTDFSSRYRATRSTMRSSVCSTCWPDHCSTQRRNCASGSAAGRIPGARPRPRNPLRCRHRHSAWRSASVRGVSRRQPRDAAGGRRGISAGAARLSPALLPDGPTRTADRGALCPSAGSADARLPGMSVAGR